MDGTLKLWCGSACCEAGWIEGKRGDFVSVVFKLKADITKYQKDGQTCSYMNVNIICKHKQQRKGSGSIAQLMTCIKSVIKDCGF